MLKSYKKLTILISLVFPLSVAYAQTEAHCDKLQKILNNFRNKYKVTGVGLYVRWGVNNSNSCYLFSGTVKKGENKAISRQNLWQIGSITKSYFAALLLQLEAESESEAGKIPVKFNINQKLGQWLPKYSNWSSVTIKQLLNMTSGIYNYTELSHINALISDNPKKIWSSTDIVNLAYQHKPNIYFSPGKAWYYSDTNYIILGLIIQKIYKKLKQNFSLQEALNKNISNRLNLTNTYYAPDGLSKKLLARMVHGYNYYNKKDYTTINLSIAGTAGGMISTPKEIAQWILNLFNGKVLPPKQFKKMKSLVSTRTGLPVNSDKAVTYPGYGLGLMEQHNKQFGEIWLYQGLTAGYTALYYYVPKYQTIISLTVSTGDIQKFPISYSDFTRKILKIIFNDNKSLISFGKNVKLLRRESPINLSS